MNLKALPALALMGLLRFAPSAHAFGLGAGILGARGQRSTPGPVGLDWAGLLEQVFGADLGTCTQCGGKRKIIATIYDGPTAQTVPSAT
jgi:hypothetical protein